MNIVAEQYSERIVAMERRRDALKECPWREVIRACTTACAFSMSVLIHSASATGADAEETTELAIRTIESNLALAEEFAQKAEVRAENQK